jgi:hypothetical protein
MLVYLLNLVDMEPEDRRRRHHRMDKEIGTMEPVDMMDQH